MFSALINACKSFFIRVKNQLKKITKPSTATIAAAVLSDLPRSKSDLIAENAILRQQLIVLNRQVKRPQLTTGDRLRLVFLSRLTRFWQTALHIIFNLTLFCAGIVTCFVCIGNGNPNPTSVNYVYLKRPSTSSNR
jgi:hypothetical protein